MIESEEPIPFAFYIGENEIAASVGETLREMVLVFLYFVIYTDSIPGHTEAILHVSFSPDGTVLGTGGGDMTVRFWDVSTCTPIKTCTGHK